MNLKEDLFYFFALFIEYSLNPRSFIWSRIAGRPTYTYQYFQRKHFDRSKLDMDKLIEKSKSLKESISLCQRQFKSRWNGIWYMVIFDIPEKQRRFRDVFRNRLTELGFGQLQKSIFISPFNWKDELKQYFDFEGVKDRILFIELKKIHGFDTQELIRFCWHGESSERAYKEFLDDFEKRLKRFDRMKKDLKDNERKATTRWLYLSLQYYFHALLKDYPPLPRELMMKDTIAKILFQQGQKWLMRLEKESK